MLFNEDGHPFNNLDMAVRSAQRQYKQECIRAPLLRQTSVRLALAKYEIIH